MKSQFKMTPLALAVAALFISPLAFAEDNISSSSEVSLDKEISVEQTVEFDGDVDVVGVIRLDSSSMAVVVDKQTNNWNDVTNDESKNTATVDGNTLNNAKGNIGVNVTAGDNNQQANAAALSAADASFVFGSSDAEIFASQYNDHNRTYNRANTNTATLGSSALANASGNIGVNISAGDNNQQKNDLAASVAVARMATATVHVDQSNGHNNTHNDPKSQDTIFHVPVSLDLTAKVDPHSDASDEVDPTDISVVEELTETTLSGSVTGVIPVVVSVNKLTTNVASLGGNALMNATGNIGVNIAAGTNNQQYNGLAISATQAGKTAGGSGGGGGGE